MNLRISIGGFDGTILYRGIFKHEQSLFATIMF